MPKFSTELAQERNVHLKRTEGFGASGGLVVGLRFFFFLDLKLRRCLAVRDCARCVFAPPPLALALVVFVVTSTCSVTPLSASDSLSSLRFDVSDSQPLLLRRREVACSISASYMCSSMFFLHSCERLLP